MDVARVTWHDIDSYIREMGYKTIYRFHFKQLFKSLDRRLQLVLLEDTLIDLLRSINGKKVDLFVEYATESLETIKLDEEQPCVAQDEQMAGVTVEVVDGEDHRDGAGKKIPVTQMRIMIPTRIGYLEKDALIDGYDGDAQESEEE